MRRNGDMSCSMKKTRHPCHGVGGVSHSMAKLDNLVTGFKTLPTTVEIVETFNLKF